MFSTPQWDLDLFTLINRTRHPFLDWIMPVLSETWILWVLGLGLLVWCLWRKRADIVVLVFMIGAAIGLTDASTNLIKDSVGRVRPYKSLAGTYYQSGGEWKQRPQDYRADRKTGSSYPSAHAANTMALAVGLMIFWKRTRPWILLLPLLVGYSRIYLGKHYPLDVSVGWAWGMTIAGIVLLLCREFLLPWLVKRFPFFNFLSDFR